MKNPAFGGFIFQTDVENKSCAENSESYILPVVYWCIQLQLAENHFFEFIQSL